MPAFRDLRGLRFGKLVVQGLVFDSSKTGVVWRCICSCGNYKEVKSSHLWEGTSTHCGCVNQTHKKCRTLNLQRCQLHTA